MNFAYLEFHPDPLKSSRSSSNSIMKYSHLTITSHKRHFANSNYLLTLSPLKSHIDVYYMIMSLIVRKECKGIQNPMFCFSSFRANGSK